MTRATAMTATALSIELNQFVTDVFRFEVEHPEVSLHRNYIWEPPAGYRGAYHPSWRTFLEQRRKVALCPTCGQPRFIDGTEESDDDKR